MTKWAVAEAKARFSAVLDQAEIEGPQLLERRKRRFVLLTEEELNRRTRHPAGTQHATPGALSGKRQWEALRMSPDDGVEVKLQRPRWKPRQVQL